MVKQEYLWYAYYGSNLDQERFMIYIRGGSLNIGGHLVTTKSRTLVTSVMR